MLEEDALGRLAAELPAVGHGQHLPAVGVAAEGGVAAQDGAVPRVLAHGGAVVVGARSRLHRSRSSVAPAEAATEPERAHKMSIQLMDNQSLPNSRY